MFVLGAGLGSYHLGAAHQDAARQNPDGRKPDGQKSDRSPKLADVLAKLDEGFEKSRVEQKVVGMSVVIVHDQDVLLAKGYGYADLASKTPADKQTVYRVGSITKVFTALAMMQLRDAGKLDLDDPIEKYLPEFKIKSRFPNARPVTFRQVASHYSGLPTEAPLPYSFQDVPVFPRTEELIVSLANSELQVPVNTQSIYSNLGYNILGLRWSGSFSSPMQTT